MVSTSKVFAKNNSHILLRKKQLNYSETIDLNSACNCCTWE